MLCPLGLRGRTMAMSRDELVDHIAPNGAPGSKTAKENNGAQSHAAPNGATAWAPWIRNANEYDRRERREFQVTRFG
jgi:hypothetical protein